MSEIMVAVGHGNEMEVIKLWPFQVAAFVAETLESLAPHDVRDKDRWLVGRVDMRDGNLSSQEVFIDGARIGRFRSVSVPREFIKVVYETWSRDRAEWICQ
jgi:hypothetical protein